MATTPTPTLTQQVAALVATNVTLSALAQQIIANGKGSDGRSLTNRGAWQAKTYVPGDYVFSVGSNGTTNSLWFLLDATNYASSVAPAQDPTHWQELTSPANAAAAVWGGLTGNLTDQPDLAEVLAAYQTAIGQRIRFDATQSLSTTEASRAQANLGLTNRILPTGGTTGQVLSLTANGPVWVTPSTTTAPTPSPAPAPAPSPAPAPAPAPTEPSVITMGTPTLSKTSFEAGETVNVSVYINTTGSAQTVQKVILTTRRPGATHAGGPFDDFMLQTGVRFNVGQKLFTGSFTFPTSGDAGQWEFFTAIQDANGSYTDGPSAFATLNASTTVAQEYFPYAGPENRYFPADAVDVPWSNRSNLQTLLNSGTKVALRDSRDYSDGLPGPLSLPTGGQVYGIPGFTRLSKGINPQDGCSNYVIKGFQDASVNFNGTTQVHSNGVIGLGRTNIYSNGAKLDRPFFLRPFEAQVRLDNGTTGWFHNPRLFAPQWHGGGNVGLDMACLSFVGRDDGSSYGLTIAGANCLTPPGSCVQADKVDSVTMIACDVEADSNGSPDRPAIVMNNIGDFTLMGVGGKTVRGVAMDINAKKVTLINPALDSNHSAPRMKYRNVEASAIYSGGKSGIVLDLSDVGASGTDANPRFFAQRVGQRKKLQWNGVEVGTLNSSQVTAAVKLVVDELKSYVRWGRPNYRAPSTPLGGDNWKADRAGKASMRAELQSLLDAAASGNKVALISKNYYIDNTVYWPKGVAWVATGSKATCGITCINDSFPAIRFNFGGVIGGGAMVDISIMGGSEAILANESNTYFVNSWFCNVDFRGQTNSNIALYQTLAWDNNYFEYCNFMDAAVCIRSNGIGNNEEPGVSYMDKQFFFRCQFLNAGRMIDLNARRPNNGLTWNECYFKGLTNGLFLFRDTIEPHFVNSVVEECSIASGGVLCDYKGVVSWYGMLFKNNQATYIAQQGHFWEGLEVIKGSNNGTFFKNVTDNDPRDQSETTLVNCDMGDQPTGFGDGSATNVSVVISNTRCLAPEDSLWNSGIGAITHDTKTNTDANDDFHAVQARWLNWAPKPGTRILRDRVA